MPSYAYKGVAASGRRVEGRIEADSPRNARARLRQRSVFASEIEAAGPRTRGRMATGKVPTRQLAATLRQLATLLAAGVPLVEAVSSVGRRNSNARMAAALESAAAHITEGGSLEGAMADQDDVFPSMYTGMVGAGEASGSLDLVLENIADHAEAGARLQARVRIALTYPIIMAVVGTLIVFFLLAYVVPQVTRVFLEANQSLPLATRALMWLGQAAAAYGLQALALVAAASLALRSYRQTEPGRRRLDRLMFSLPKIGTLARDVASARLAQTMATTLAGGLTVVAALEASRTVAGGGLVADALAEAQESISEGQSVADCLERSGLFNPMLTDMVAVGERSGQLEEMLAKAATVLDEEVRSRVEIMASLLEPAMILGMAVVVLFVVLAILLPVFEMNQLVR